MLMCAIKDVHLRLQRLASSVIRYVRYVASFQYGVSHAVGSYLVWQYCWHLATLLAFFFVGLGQPIRDSVLLQLYPANII